MNAMTPSLRAGFKVLVVDDDPSVLKCYRRLLCRAGYTTVTEDDPRKVLQSDAQADLLLLDYKMPGMDGLSLLAELRRRACRARCILISAFLNDDVRLRAIGFGQGSAIEDLKEHRRCRVAFEPIINDFNGRRTVEMQILDMQFPT